MRDVKPFLKHILDECCYLEEASKNLEFEDFMADENLKRAFVRSLEIIGEATKNLSEEFRNKYMDIPWSQIAGLRDVLIHKYFGVDYRNVWLIIKNEIPQLKKSISKILEELEMKEE